MIVQHDFTPHPAPLDRRRLRRTRILLSARMAVAGRLIEVRLRDFSPLGCLVESNALVLAGEEARLGRDGFFMSGQVMWAKERRFGFEFDAPVDIEQLSGRAPARPHRIPEWARVDRGAGHRRPGVLTHPVSAEEARIAAAWTAGDPSLGVH